MKDIRSFIRQVINENIDVPINVGDTVLGGKFKNKKVVVKDIDKNDKGDITINDKPLLRVRTLEKEDYTPSKDIFYHGTKTKLPFKKFESNMDGSGLVSSGKKYGGFFFTDSMENAEFYTEYFVCKVQINNIQPNPTHSKNSPEVLKQANLDNKIYLIEDILDGAVFSNIVVVPYSQINNVNIIEWEFIGDKEFYFEQLDKLFGMDEENYITQDSIREFCEMTETNLNFLLSVDVFQEYYNSKN